MRLPLVASRRWYDPGPGPATPSWRFAGYLLYFAAAAKYVGCQCIGVAHSSFPAGPYYSGSGQPLVCPSSEGGAIDPSPYTTADGDRCSFRCPERLLVDSATAAHRISVIHQMQVLLTVPGRHQVPGRGTNTGWTLTSKSAPCMHLV